jgi:hypothetical protein
MRADSERGERRHTERQSRDVVEARVRELATAVHSLQQDVDALVHRPLIEPWQSGADEKTFER